MIIMQTVDALARKSYIESKGFSKVIFFHETEDSTCVQYHPKGFRGMFHRIYSCAGHLLKSTT
jgi:hypothetical protein